MIKTMNITLVMETLLQEIDSICKENGMPYYLMGETLVYAMRGKGFPLRRKYLSIAMHANDVDRFIKAVDKINNRTTESLLNNKKFPGFYLRYIDLDSLMYDTSKKSQKYDNYCIGINIYILFPYRKSGSKKSIIIEKARNKWAKWIGEEPSKFNLQILQQVAVLGKLTRHFRKMLKRKPTKKGSVECYTEDGSHLIFDKKNFGQGKTVEINSYTYMIPFNPKIVAKKTNFGTLLLGNKNMKCVLNRSFIVAYGIPGNEFLDRITNGKLIKSNNIKRYNWYKKWKEEVFEPIWAKRLEYYEYYFLTKERFMFYKYLCLEQKEYIKKLYAECDFDELSDVMASYLRRMKVHSKRHFGLYFDKDIFVIAIVTMVYLELNNENLKNVAIRNVKRIIRIVDLIPQPYLIPIEDIHRKDSYSSEQLEIIRSDIKAEINEIIESMIR